MGWLDSLHDSVVGFDTMPLIYYGASFFLTNDIHLPSLPNLKTLVLDDLKKRSEG
jgi:hypothetical protein